MQPFEHTPPEARELLKKPIRELGLKLDGSPVEKYVQQLHRELEAKGLERFRPACYLSDEWACPDREPIIGIPFYLADPELQALERSLNDLEDEREILMYLRHEAGHAFNYAYELYDTPEWIELFGPFDRPYADSYTPVPFSRRYVRHIAGWYAQKHPDEDFAETFAVWMGATPDEWRQRYRGWKALEKLEYINTLMQEAAGKPPLVKSGHRISEARKLRKTLNKYYAARRKIYAEDFPDFYDADLRAIFTNGEPGGESAARIMRKHRAALIQSIVQWTGQRKYTVSMLVRKLILRCQELKLPAPFDTVRLHFELTAYLATLVTNHLYTGRFKRSV